MTAQPPLDEITPLPVSAHDIGFHYPGGPMVLDGFSLRIEPGQRLALLGPNGSGKTTFALHLNGLLPLQSGSISVGDVPVVEDRLVEVRPLVGSVFQDPDDQLFMNTVHDDVAFGPANLGIDGDARQRRVDRALDAVGAADLAERTSHHLSGGEKRRAAIATVLSMEPSVLVLDEPTSGLDPAGRRALSELLVTLPQTQIVITHDLAFAAATCERAVIVDGGRIVADDTPGALIDQPDLLFRHRLA